MNRALFAHVIVTSGIFQISVGVRCRTVASASNADTFDFSNENAAADQRTEVRVRGMNANPAVTGSDQGGEQGVGSSASIRGVASGGARFTLGVHVEVKVDIICKKVAKHNMTKVQRKGKRRVREKLSTPISASASGYEIIVKFLILGRQSMQFDVLQIWEV